MRLEINVYDENDTIIKTCEAHTIDLEFGTIRSLMKLLNVDNVNDTGELLNIVYGAWEQLVEVLGKCFPDMEADDWEHARREWEHVKLKELIPAILNILKASFADILSIPKDPKN